MFQLVFDGFDPLSGLLGSRGGVFWFVLTVVNFLKREGSPPLVKKGPRVLDVVEKHRLKAYDRETLQKHLVSHNRFLNLLAKTPETTPVYEALSGKRKFYVRVEDRGSYVRLESCGPTCPDSMLFADWIAQEKEKLKALSPPPTPTDAGEGRPDTPLLQANPFVEYFRSTSEVLSGLTEETEMRGCSSPQWFEPHSPPYPPPPSPQPQYPYQCADYRCPFYQMHAPSPLSPGPFLQAFAPQQPEQPFHQVPQQQQQQQQQQFDQVPPPPPPPPPPVEYFVQGQPAMPPRQTFPLVWVFDAFPPTQIMVYNRNGNVPVNYIN